MADGSIIIDTQINTSGVMKGADVVKAGMNRLSNQIAKMGNEAKSSFQKQIMGITDLYQAYEKQERKVSELKAKLEELSKVRIETEEYKRLDTEIKELEDNFVKVEAKQKEWLDMGFPIDSAPLKELDKQMDVIWTDIEKLQQKQKEMKISGAAYIDPTSTEEYKRTAATYNSESQKLERVNGRLYSSYNNLKNKMEEYWQKNNRLAQVMEKLQRAASRVGIVVKNMGSALRSAGSSIKSMVSAMKKAVENMFNLNKQTNRSRMSLSRMLGMSLLFSGVFRAISAIGDGVKTGFQNLAQYSNSTNSAISSLMSALTRLKNSFATAFAPILTTVAPILTSFINLISEAVTRVGMLIAALTGKDTFTKAIGVQENYAASLDKSASSANKAKKATKGYLSSLDEIKRYDDGKSNTGTGSNGKYTGPSASDMFATVPIESSIKDIADKIKQYIEGQDWEGLGSYMADGINTGLEKVYEVISWDNVGPKIEPFITAFTTTFNSLDDQINWELVGQTLGSGINTAVNTLNLLIGEGGIDFEKIGSSIARGLRGAIKEINWTSLGKLLGNKFMISWKMLSGFVKEMSKKDGAGITGWKALGESIGRAMTGMFNVISFTDIADAIVGVINGAFEILAGFDNEFDWKSFQENLKSGIQTMVNDIDWKGNGKAFGDFLSHLCDCITAAINNGTFQKLGEGIGEFLAELPWKKLLETAATALIDGLGGALDGLWRSSLAGKITAGLIVAFGAVKVAQITGLDHLAAYLIGRLATKLISAENTASLTDGVETVLGNALKGATGAASDFVAALGPLVGTAGLIIAVGSAATVATSELAGFVETMQGGNGIGGTFGNTMNNFIQTLQHRGDIISGSAEEIWQLKESLEQEGMTAEDKASATQKLIDKLGEMGVTSDQAEQAFSSLYQQGLITDDMFDILSESIKTLGDNTTNMAGSIDLSKQSIDDLYNNVLPQLQTQLGLSADQVTSLDTALLETESAGGTAQDAFDNIMARAEEMGINTESVAKIFSQVFPDAVKETESSTKTAMENAQDSVETGMDAATVAVGTAMSGIQTDTENAMSAAEKSVSDSTSNINTDTVTNWGNSAEEVDKNLDRMKQHANLKLGEMHKTVESHFSSQYNTMTKKWERAQERIEQIISEMIKNINTSLEGFSRDISSVGKRIGNNLLSGISSGIRGITNILNDVIGKVNSMVGSINNAISGIERGFTFSYNVQLPNGGRRWGNYSMSLPRVSTVPYLASGAVIPPRSEFLAVLGDQKNGRNLEAPEGLIREIIDDAFAKNQQSSGGTFRFIAQVDRRTLFDKVIEEAKLRRDTSGNNPFELS